MPDEISFADERFLSGQQKTKVLQAWRRFLKGGCRKPQFTEDLYHHLSQHCSFIAHYDRHGFYAFYFEEITSVLFRFFNQFDPELPGISAEYGTTHWLSEYNTGADLNHAMRAAAGPYLAALRQQFEEVRRQREISAANVILGRHGLVAVPATATAPICVEPTEPPEEISSPRPTAAPLQPPLFRE